MKIAAKRNIAFIVALLLIILDGRLLAQENMASRGSALPESLVFKVRPVAASEAGTGIFIASVALFNQPSAAQGLPSPSTALPMDYYSEHLGFFCKMEWSFEKNAHLPLKFRLGSLEYCNFLEGKK